MLNIFVNTKPWCSFGSYQGAGIHCYDVYKYIGTSKDNPLITEPEFLDGF